MKKKIKKLLRLLLVFLYSFALVCFCLPAKATAQEYNGNSYTYPFTHTVDSTKLWACYLYQKLEEQGYYVSSKIKDFSDEVKEVCLEYGIDVYNAAGEYIDTGAEYVNTITGLVIDYSNPYIQEFIEGSKNWEITDKASDTWDFYYNLYEHFFSFSDYLTIEQYFDNPNSFTAEGRDNIDKYFSFKNYGLSRGNYKDIPGSILNPDYFHPTQIDLRFGTRYPDGQTSADYSVPVDGSETFSQGIGNNSFVDCVWTIGACSFEVTARNYSEVYCIITLYGCDGGETFSIVNTDFHSNSFRVEALNNCSITNSGVVTVSNNNNNMCQLQVRYYGDSHGTGNKYFFDLRYNAFGGGVDAPEKPVYKAPNVNSPNYETENNNYNYFTTETDRLLDEMTLEEIEGVIDAVDEHTWFSFPLYVYRSLGTSLLNGYSGSFIFNINDIDLSFVAEGLHFPAVRFSFVPEADLDSNGLNAFNTFRYVIAFGYLWAIIMWGRSLILRIGSDTLHKDYED